MDRVADHPLTYKVLWTTWRTTITAFPLSYFLSFALYSGYSVPVLSLSFECSWRYASCIGGAAALIQYCHLRWAFLCQEDNKGCSIVNVCSLAWDFCSLKSDHQLSVSGMRSLSLAPTASNTNDQYRRVNSSMPNSWKWEHTVWMYDFQSSRAKIERYSNVHSKKNPAVTIGA